MKFTYEEDGDNRDYVVNGNQVRIGRDPEGEIMTKNRSVSRKHITCTVENGQLVAHDEGSANGMFVNDVRVTEAVLKDGDVLRAGQFAMTFSAGVAAPVGGGFLSAGPKQDMDGTMVDMAFGGAAEIPQAPPPPQHDMAAAFAQAAAAPMAVAAPPMPAYAPPQPAFAQPQQAYAQAPYAPPGGGYPPAPGGYPPAPPYGAPPGGPPMPGGFPPPPPAAAVGAGTALGTVKITKGMEPKSFELRAGTKITIGSKEDNVIVISGDGISRHHSEIFPRGKEWVIKDLGSKNGTYVNAQKVTERPLASNDVIAIGSIQLKFNLAGAGGGKGGDGGDAAKKRKLLMFAGAGAVALCVVMVLAMSGNGAGTGGPKAGAGNTGPGPDQPNPGGGVSPEKLSLMIQKVLDTYNQSLRTRFLDPTLNGQASSLLAELNSPNVMPPAHLDKPAISRLASILTECQNKQPSYAEMNWKEMEQRAIELRNYPAVGKLADKLIEWVRAENTAKGHMGDGKDYMRSNRHDEAFSSFKKIDQESVYNKEASNKMLELKGIITDRTAREANQKVRSGDFQSALDEINRVLNIFEGKYPDVLVTLNPLKKECEKNLKYQNLVSEAEILIAQKRLDDAEAKLLSIDLGAPPSVLTKVERLKEDIGVQRAMSAANERYSQGDGKAAIQILQNETHPELVKLRTKIQKVVDATTAAQNATAKNLFDEAKRHWGEVLGLEPDEKNRYHTEAVKNSDGGPTASDAAKREHDRGFEAQQADQLAEARQHYDKAMELFPNYQDSVSAIKQFVRDAQKKYNFDRADFQKGKLTLDVIIPKWENVLGFLRPSDGPMYNQYKDGLEKLKTTGRF